MIKRIRSVLASINSWRDSSYSLPKNNKSCSTLCPTCEIEVSEKTAFAIVKVLNLRIESSQDYKVVTELNYIKELILNGSWHNYYDASMKEEKLNVI